MNELKSESTIFNKLTNEVMSDLNMFGPRVLNKIFRDIDDTGIVTIDSEMFLTDNIINEEFWHPKKFGATVTSNNVFSLSSGERERVLLLAYP